MSYEELSKDTISLNVDALNWQESIRKAGELLLNKGFIEQEYVEDCITNVKEHGPYIVIDNGIAIAHSNPGKHVFTTSMALITTSTGINFGHDENDPVKIVIMLATVDSKSHMSMLKKLVNVFQSQPKKQRIMETSDIQEVIELFKEEDYEKVL